MSSIFGNDEIDARVQTIAFQTIEATDLYQAVEKLDDEVSIFRNSVQLNPLDQIINDIKDDIQAIDINNVNSQLNTLQTTKLDITTYDNNVPGYQTAGQVNTAITNANNAQDSTIASTYKTISSFNSDIANYRTSSAQDTIDATKYSTSNPSNYQTSGQVSSSINSALVPYRTSADEDVINATKLNTTDLKAPIIPFDVPGGFIPSSVSIQGANAYYDLSFYTNLTTKTLQYTNAPIFTSNLIVNNFLDANYGVVGVDLYDSLNGTTWNGPIHTFSDPIVYMKKVGTDYMIFQDSAFNVYYTTNATTFPFYTNLGEAIKDTHYSSISALHYILTTSTISGTFDFSSVSFSETIVDSSSTPVSNANFILEDEGNNLLGIAFTNPELRVLTYTSGTFDPLSVSEITLAGTFNQMKDIIRYGLTNNQYYLCSQDRFYYIINLDLLAPFTFNSIAVSGGDLNQMNLFVNGGTRYVEVANTALGGLSQVYSFSMLNDTYITSVDNVRAKYIALLYDDGSSVPVDYININTNSGLVQCDNVQDACLTLNNAQVEIRTNLSTNYTNTTNLNSALNLKYNASNPSGYQTASDVATTLQNYSKYETSYVGILLSGLGIGTTYPFSTTWNTTEKSYLVGAPLVIEKLLVNMRVNTSSGGTQTTFTLRKNGVDTAMTCTILNNASQLNDISTASPVSFTTGDVYSVKSVRTYTSGTQTDISIAVMIRYV